MLNTLGPYSSLYGWWALNWIKPLTVFLLFDQSITYCPSSVTEWWRLPRGSPSSFYDTDNQTLGETEDQAMEKGKATALPFWRGGASGWECLKVSWHGYLEGPLGPPPSPMGPVPSHESSHELFSLGIRSWRFRDPLSLVYLCPSNFLLFPSLVFSQLQPLLLNSVHYICPGCTLPNHPSTHDS